MAFRIRLGQHQHIEQRILQSELLGSNAQAALAALRDTSAALGAAGITHWLTYGALLGLVREGRLLAHDGDIDFAVLRGAGSDAAAVAMAAAGFAFFSEERVAGRIALQKFRRGPVKLDLFHVEEAGGVYRDYTALDDYSLCSGAHPMMALTPLDCGGFSVPAPADREAYLRHLYGPGWRKPVTAWDWRFAPNVTLDLHWRSAPRVASGLLRLWFRRRAGVL